MRIGKYFFVIKIIGYNKEVINKVIPIDSNRLYPISPSIPQYLFNTKLIKPINIQWKPKMIIFPRDIIYTILFGNESNNRQQEIINKEPEKPTK